MRIKGGYRTVCSVCGRDVGAVLNWEKMQAGRLVGEYRVARHVHDPHSRKTAGRPMCPGGGILIHAKDVTTGGRPPQVERSQHQGGLAGEFPNS